MTDRERRRRGLVLALLVAANTMNFFDRQILGAVTEPIRREWGLTDTQIGALGTSFTLLYALVGIPLGRLADTWNRKRLLSASLAFWSAMTYASGLCRNYGALFAARLGIGVGEAGCAPVSSSLIGDMFPPDQRSRALSIFMLGLPLGGALSFIVSGSIAQHFGWRPAFFVAGLPGLALALAALFIQEPRRGSAEILDVGKERRPGSPYRLVFGIPTMRWIVASGVIHNFNMYTLSSFLPALLTRHHQVTVQSAGYITGLLIGLLGALGSLAGGWLGDFAIRRRFSGRMLISSAAACAGVPAAYLAFSRPSGELLAFVTLLAIAIMAAYIYYPLVYATIQDIIEPSLRGTAMAAYFFAMYLLGGSLGPLGTGWLSDFLARRAARQAGAWIANGQIPEAFRAVGLRHAMYVIPALGAFLALVLAAGSSTVQRDMEKLRDWMKRTSGR